VRRFTVEEYHRLSTAGVLTEDDRVELLEGWIVPKVTHSPRHDATVDQAHATLREALPKGWRIRVQSVITTGDSEPEPDLAVVRGPAGRYLRRHPGKQDIALVVEVADSSLLEDRSLKGRLYARAGLRQYWIINLLEGEVEVYSGSSRSAGKPSFRTRRVHGRNDRVPLIIGGKVAALVPVKDLLASKRSD
jgi:Uma2 family endonuclease